MKQKHNRYLAIQGLLDLYNKEKEQNKRLSDEYMIQKHLINADFLRDYISKDKIREKIKEIKDRKVEDKFISATTGKLNTIIELEKLLEEGE